MEGRADGRVLGIGELLWDLFPDGPRLGGAPFNVVAHLRRLGHPAAFVTAVGDDELGRAALAATDGLGVEATFIGVSAHLPTGTVAVAPDPVAGHRFTIGTPAAYESIEHGDALVTRVRAWRPDALVFGTLAQRFDSVSSVTQRVAREIRPAHRLYDVNLRDGCWTPGLVLDLLGAATIVKVNDDEADILAGLLDTPATPSALGSALASRYGVTTVCITRGADGAALWSAGRGYQVDGIAVDVVDTVGAGDAFAARLLHGVLGDEPPAVTLAAANRLGASVASGPGALPLWRPDEIASDRDAGP